jgi:hypothetical protein
VRVSKFFNFVWPQLLRGLSKCHLQLLERPLKKVGHLILAFHYKFRCLVWIFIEAVAAEDHLCLSFGHVVQERLELKFRYAIWARPKAVFV